MKKLEAYSRIVIKIGSALLVDPQTGLKKQWLESVCHDIAQLKRSGAEVMVVSSGAIALGRRVLGLPSGVLRLEESQAAAAAGQIELSRAFSRAFGDVDLSSGQILLTLGDTEIRRRYLNARATIHTLTRLGAIPIINENDTVATAEIRYGDNDRLAARVATMVSADLLILLSDIDGLYTAPPNQVPDASLIKDVPVITPEIEAMAGDAGTQLSRGGMVTKIMAAKMATSAGTTMVITSGKQENPLERLADGANATWFAASESPVTARKKWIGGHIETSGQLIVDDGAWEALKKGKSLLPAGVIKIEGSFSRGDTVSILSKDLIELGLGLVACDASVAERIIGRRSDEISKILGYTGRSEIVHRDDMVLHQLQTIDNQDKE